MKPSDSSIALLQERLRCQIFFTAKMVEFLFWPILLTEIEIQHTGNAIYSDAVNMVFFEPVNQVADKE